MNKKHFLLSPEPENNGGSTENINLEALKGDIDKKIGTIDQKIDQFNAQQAELLGAIKEMSGNFTQSAQSDPQVNTDDDWGSRLYTDPNGVIQDITKKVSQDINTKITDMEVKKNQQATVINQLVSEYPELSDKNSDVHRDVLTIFKSMSDPDKESGLGYKTAILEAITKNGLLPLNKRKNKEDMSDDDFVFGSHPSNRSTNSDRVNINMLKLAQKLKVLPPEGDPKHEEVKKKLKQYSKKRMGQWGTHE